MSVYTNLWVGLNPDEAKILKYCIINIAHKARQLYKSFKYENMLMIMLNSALI